MLAYCAKALRIGKQQAVQRDGVGHPGGPADRAEEDRVEAAQGVDPVGGHHRAGGDVGLAGPVEAGDLEPRPARGGNREGGVGHGDADPVAGDRGDAVGLHAASPSDVDQHAPGAAVDGCDLAGRTLADRGGRRGGGGGGGAGRGAGGGGEGPGGPEKGWGGCGCRGAGLRGSADVAALADGSAGNCAFATRFGTICAGIGGNHRPNRARGGSHTDGRDRVHPRRSRGDPVAAGQPPMRRSSTGCAPSSRATGSRAR